MAKAKRAKAKGKGQRKERLKRRKTNDFNINKTNNVKYKDQTGKCIYFLQRLHKKASKVRTPKKHTLDKGYDTKKTPIR